MPLDGGSSRAFLTSLTGALGASVAGRLGASLAKVIPGVGTIGGGVALRSRAGAFPANQAEQHGGDAVGEQT